MARHVNGLKVCSECRETKTIDFFGNDRSSADGLDHCCKACRVERRKRSQESQWRCNLKLRFGITTEQYMEILDSQGGVCAICRGGPTNRHRRLSVDHCHLSGKVRGILCQRCNTAIGLLRENPQSMLAAVLYLERHCNANP